MAAPGGLGGTLEGSSPTSLKTPYRGVDEGLAP